MAPELLKRERNVLFEAIQAHSLDPLKFGWTERVFSDIYSEAGTVTALVHESEDFFFSLGTLPDGSWSVEYSPGSQSRFEYQTGLSWGAVRNECDTWARCLAEEISAPDLWSSFFTGAGSLVAAATRDENSRFSESERQRLFSSLDQILVEAKRTQRLSKIQTDLLIGSLDNARDAATRLGRKDWTLLFLGTLVQALVSAAMDPQVTQTIISAADASLAWLAGTNILPSR